jgi:hypothetical protein
MRTIGMAKSHHDGIYCTLPLCSVDTASTSNEGRDAVFVELVKVHSHNVAKTAESLGITRQRAYQILRERAAV